MSEGNEWTVAGFNFSSAEDAETARQEIQKINYLEKRMNYDQPESILVVYQKVLDNKLMKTPVGWECLSRMRQQMITAGIAPERIPAIVLHNNFTARSAGGSGLRADGEVADIMASGIARQRIRPTEHREKTEAEKYRSRFRMAVGVSIILFGIVVAMFVIALNSSNPNIINYENRILDKYSSWEEELTIREQAVKEKERALNG